MTDAAVTGVGQELAAAREARGLALADVAQQLKFAPRQLEALEQEHFEQLPGATFTRGMVRSYARLLRIDPEPLLQRIASRIEIPDSNRLAARYHQPVPFSDSARRSTFVYIAVSLGVLVLVGGVAYQWQQERASSAAKKSPAVAKAKTPARETRQEPPPPQRPAAPPPVPVQQAVAPVIVPEKPEQKPQEKPLAKLPEKPQEKPVAKPLPPSRPGANRLVVRTEGEAWIEIKDSADRMLVSSLNPPGTERVVRGKPPYTLVIGNASNVRVTLDDKLIDLAPHTRQDVARLTVP